LYDRHNGNGKNKLQIVPYKIFSIIYEMEKEKIFLILAGANGVGKTTLSKEILNKYNQFLRMAQNEFKN
jgi:ABC-type Mn2+/Zn2+ transport system ATPase subunit